MQVARVCVASWLAGFAMVAQAQLASHCTSAEVAVWLCRSGAKHYSLCASRDLDRQRGYLQYRAGKLGAIEFLHPTSHKHPAGAFTFGLLPHGASLGFEVGSYSYDISEDLKDQTVIFVTGPARSGTVTCDASTHSLTLTSTINFLESVGITGKAQ